MSKSVSPLEVEDVLTSIRRLVSDDTKMPPIPAESVAPEGESNGSGAELTLSESKLILTDALRVDEGQGDSQNEDSTASADDDPARDADTVSDSETDHVNHDAITEPAESDGSDAGDWSVEDDDAAMWAGDADADTADDQDDGEDMAAPDDDGAEDEADEATELRTDGPGTDQYENIEGGSVGAAPEAEGTGRRLHLTASTADFDAGEADESGAGQQDEEDDATEASHAGGEQQMESATQMGDDAGDDNLVEELQEKLFDEDTLSLLVSQIVREELTGELGERITRNVKKLVRREVQRALASREFE